MTKKKRGFATMDPERRRELARMGGAAVPSEKRAFSQNTELATKAGKKGGDAVPNWKRSFFKDPELAREAGRKGGTAAQRNRREKTDEA